MVQAEDGLQVFDQAAWVEGTSFTDSGNKERGAGSEFRVSRFGFKHA